jgi:hypothetical protein
MEALKRQSGITSSGGENRNYSQMIGAAASLTLNLPGELQRDFVRQVRLSWLDDMK